MPSRFCCKPGKSLKSLKLTTALLLLPLVFWGQGLTGLWTGALSNDSSTVRKDQLFEIALTEYKGKVYGYSRSEFIVNDTLYYIVKRVKGTINGDICEVTDDEIVAYNFRGKLDKGIKVTSTFKRNGSDSAWYLAGTWKTNATKKYYSVTGKVDLGQEKDLSRSKIFPHLEELKMADEIAFYKERNEAPVVARIAKPQRVKTEYSFNPDPAGAIPVSAPELVRTDPDPVTPDIQKSTTDIARTNTKTIPNSSSHIPVTAPELVRTDPDPVIPDIKKSPTDIARTNTKTIPNSSSNIPVTAPELVRTDPDPVIPDIKKSPTDIARTNTKTIPNNSTTVPVSAPDLVRTDPDPVSPEIKKSQSDLARTGSPVKDTRSTAPQAPANPSVAANKTTAPGNAVQNTNAKSNPANPVANNQSKSQPNNNPANPAQSIATNKNNVATNPAPQASQKAPVISQPQSQPAVKDHYADINNIQKPQPGAAGQKTNDVAMNKVAAPQIVAPKKSIEELTKNVTTIAGRKSEFAQVVDFKADSLVLSLYDNGEIDGDTVSVIMNGETLMAKQGLKASAIRKTIYIQPGENEDFTLVLFADNLGKYPPNTGLLVVHDGEDVYHLRFSSDFQKSTGIVFRRKK